MIFLVHPTPLPALALSWGCPYCAEMQVWQVTYKGHEIRVECTRLYVDGVLQDQHHPLLTGYRLWGQIKTGEGAGEQIKVSVGKSFWSGPKCSIFVDHVLVFPVPTLEFFSVALGGWEHVLVGLSGIMAAPYREGDFENAAAQFEEINDDVLAWTLDGTTGCSLTVKIEARESYFSGVLTGHGDVYEECKRYLWKAYTDQQGHPDVQQRP